MCLPNLPKSCPFCFELDSSSNHHDPGGKYTIESGWEAGQTYAVVAFLISLVIPIATVCGATWFNYSPNVLLCLLGISCVTAMFQLWPFFGHAKIYVPYRLCSIEP